MTRMIAGSLALAMVCGTAAYAAEDRAAAQQKNQSQSDSSAAATGGERAEQARGEAGQGNAAQRNAGDQAAASGTAADTNAAAQPAAAREDAAAMQDPTKMFIKEAYNANLFEIQSGQLAAQRAQDDKIKQLARMMVEDHTAANQQLKQVAQSSQMQLPEQLDQIHQLKLQKMQQIPAAEFGRKYVNGQVASHWMTVLEFRHQAKNAQNPQVKQFATQMLPKLEQHLKHAQQMAEQHAGGGEARTASERIPADAAGQDATGTSPTGRDAAAQPGATPAKPQE